MSRLRLFNVFHAIRDLRAFLATRGKHELVFAFLAIVTTVSIIVVFMLDSRSLKKPYERRIQYVESWPADRSDAEIIAAQKVDAANRAKREAAEARAKAERRAAFKRLDDALERLGL
ncbi:hypothetical protein GVO57_06840 [Sphingomonas changnyeongensis]|uniref:Uncharacterized protein n=1 Tax=Sphingomonas changnyeongensis TaxID=2698679 RepID=A0A7Z2S8F6_9SPHN|nr:hypothetical protein [Sphingomonas changnyeongensis]QHL90597.1 hypothetical protein GVO57_06840 [Sphingomonas changnyeongensis]